MRIQKESDKEKSSLILSSLVPAIMVLIMFFIKLYEQISGTSLSDYGLCPLKINQLYGIFTMPFLHGSWGHLWSNIVPIFFMGTMLVYYYKKSAFSLFGFLMVLTGLFTWLMGRESCHIGASGLVYGMAFFILGSALKKRETKMMAFALLVIFLYGSIIWGFFPQFFPEKNISWEGHLSGAISGVLAVFVFAKKGPKKPLYSWEIEEELDDLEKLESAEEEDVDDVSNENNQKVELKVNYHFQEKKEKPN